MFVCVFVCPVSNNCSNWGIEEILLINVIQLKLGLLTPHLHEKLSKNPIVKKTQCCVFTTRKIYFRGHSKKY